MQQYKNERLTLERVEVFTGWKNFNTVSQAPGRMDQNLLGRLWPKKVKLGYLEISAFKARDRISFQEATKNAADFKHIEVGHVFGPSWTTHWCKLDFDFPQDFVGHEVHLIWDSNCEAMLYSETGEMLQSFTGGKSNFRREYCSLGIYDPNKTPGAAPRKHTLYVEVACNGMFGVGEGGDIEPSCPFKTFVLDECSLAIFDRECWSLLNDVTLILDAASGLPKNSSRQASAAKTVNAIVNACFVDDRTTWKKGRELAAKWLSEKNADGAYKVYAIGHCHIDTTWLWPFEETVRKCGRSWATQIRLMEEFPTYKFSCPQAAQFQVVKEHYPGLYERIKQYVAQGRFIPIGGTWVEMDCNVPNGESLVRQFYYGQKFFRDEFGILCKEFWLPDTFGYAAQLPQIMQKVGIENFVTQKLSWNLFNKFPHTTFIWEGLDGSQVFAHFPPSDNYCSNGSVAEVIKTETNNKDKASVNAGLLLVGHGDGGGGCTPAMLESLTRMENVAGLPPVEFSSPQEFFNQVKRDHEVDPLPRWVGELYFELHRGTYTTHAKVKKSNRQCEILLRQAELWSAFADIIIRNRVVFEYPREELERCWKLVLLDQFHDTLPGTSIGMCYVLTHKHYADVLSSTQTMIRSALDALADWLDSHPAAKGRLLTGNGGANGDANGHVHENGSPLIVHGSGKNILIADCLGWDAPSESAAVIAVPDATTIAKNGFVSQVSKATIDGIHETLVYAQADVSHGVGLSELAPARLPTEAVPVASETADGFVLQSSKVRVVLDRNGCITSMICFDQDSDQHVEMIPEGQKANNLMIYDDIPLFWDAWDTEVYAFEKPLDYERIADTMILETGPLRGSIRFEFKVGRVSKISQIISLDVNSARLDFKTNVSWKENRKLLRAEFPVDVRSPKACYDTQFGYIERPTHWNTSWDVAKFEVCGHQYADLSMHGKGVALLNDCKYGYSIRDNVMRISLLRAPKSPDLDADMGEHQFTYSLFPHLTSFPDANVVREAMKLNTPQAFAFSSVQESALKDLIALKSSKSHVPCSAILSAVRLSDDRRHLMVRVYEALGGSSSCVLKLSNLLPMVECRESDLLDNPTGQQYALMDNSIKFVIQPFEVRSFAITIADM